MRVVTAKDAGAGTLAAADALCGWLEAGLVKRLMLAAGRTPLPLYAEVARRRPGLAGLEVFVLDEYVGVPLEHPRTCSNLLRRHVQQAWGVAPERYHALSSLESDALASVLAHELKLDRAGGLDAIVLGLGTNGHLGFNEPGSDPAGGARVLALEPVSIAANRDWFGGEHAPALGASVGLRTVLGARRALLVAFGAEKAAAVRAMLRGPREAACPASWLRGHPDAHVFLDEAAGSLL
ncbi:MAG: 6-phosphogluconolactonase [Vicinamibacteria bacterium]